MKRFLYLTGLVLVFLTLASCSRKKEKTLQSNEVPAILAEENHSFLEGESTERLSSEADAGLSETESESESESEDSPSSNLLSFLEDEANFTSPIIEESDEALPQTESVEKRLIDAYKRLKVMEYDSELFFPVNKSDSSELIHYSNKTAVRLFYDQLYRLTKKEYWKMESLENAEITGKELYYYEGDSKKPFEKKIQTKDAEFVSKLNENGLVIRVEKFVDNKSLSVTEINYDSKDRIIKQSVTEDGIVKKEVFNYTVTDNAEVNGQEALPPDYKYYENDKLVTQTEYIKKGFYSTTIWFDSQNCVRTDYENYVKVRDVYFTNGLERRVKNYE